MLNSNKIKELFKGKNLKITLIYISIFVLLIVMIAGMAGAYVMDEFTDCNNQNICHTTLGMARFYFDTKTQQWLSYSDAVVLKFENGILNLTWDNHYVYLIPEIKDKNDNKLNDNFTTSIEKHQSYYKFSHSLKKSKDAEKFKYTFLSDLDCSVEKNKMFCGNQIINFNDLNASGFSISLDKDKLLIDLSSFAENSNLLLDPTVILNSSQILKDAYVYSVNPTTNYGTANLLLSSKYHRTYISWNISRFTSKNYTILDAEYVGRMAGSDTSSMMIYELYKNATWNESGIIWNNQPCANGSGVNFSSLYCNATNFTSSTYSGATTSFYWNITSQFINNIQNGNVSMDFMTTHNTTTSTAYYSKEGTVPPTLNITYLYVGTLSNLTIYAYKSNGSRINTFTVNLSNGTTSVINITSNGSFTFLNVVNGRQYNVTINSSGYLSNTSSKTVSLDEDWLNLTMLQSGAGNFTIYDEFNNSIITGKNVTLQFISPNGTVAYNGTTLTGTYNVPLGEGFWEIRYWASGFYPRSYFVNLTSDSQIRLYLLNTTYSSLIYMQVRDVYRNNIENAYVAVYKRFMPENVYRVVDFQKTDYSGRASSYLNKCDDLYCAYYRFQVFYPLGYSRLESQSDTKIIDDLINFRIDLIGDILDSWRIVGDVYYNLTYLNITNTSGTFTLDYFDGNSIVRNACLNVTQRGTISDVLVCSSCLSATSGTLICSINQSGTYIADAFIETNSNHSLYKLDTLVQDFSDRWNVFGLMGVFMGFLITLLLVLFGIQHPQISLALLGMGLIISYFIGFIYFSYTTLIGLIVLIIIKMFIMNED